MSAINNSQNKASFCCFELILFFHSNYSIIIIFLYVMFYCRSPWTCQVQGSQEMELTVRGEEKRRGEEKIWVNLSCLSVVLCCLHTHPALSTTHAVVLLINYFIHPQAAVINRQENISNWHLRNSHAEFWRSSSQHSRNFLFTWFIYLILEQVQRNKR